MERGICDLAAINWLQARLHLSARCLSKILAHRPDLHTDTAARQLRNSVYDALTHCIDHYLTPELVPMFDRFYMCVVKELVTIGPDVIKEGSSLELHERLIMAASFALNNAFQIAKPGCYAIHQLGHQLTAKYGIDHGATLAIITKPLLETQFEVRKVIYAQSAEFVFGIDTGSVDEKAAAFIQELQKFIIALGLPIKVSDWPGAVVGPNDIEELTDAVIKTNGGVPVGIGRSVGPDVIRAVYRQVVV